MGDTMYANVLMLGCAWQSGLVPVSLEAILRAIELNGVKIDANKPGLHVGTNRGRQARGHQEAAPRLGIRRRRDLEDMIARRRDFLVEYQDEALAERFECLVEKPVL